MRQVRGLIVTILVLTLVILGPSPGAAAPEGQMTWAVHISLAPTWFDPAETSGIITPFMVIYALHDALGFAKIIWSIIPSNFEFYWQPPGYSYDRACAKQLLAEAGYPSGFDAGDYFCDAAITNIGEPVVNYLNAAGIRVKLRPIERASYFKGWSDKKYKGLIHGASGAFGNAATRIEAFVAGGGTYVYGSYADIDGLFREQTTELDPKRREATLHRIQQLVHEKVLVAPIWLNAALAGHGPPVEESGFGLIAGSCGRRRMRI